MALSPTIPTSFVPKQPVRAAAPRPKSGGGNLFTIVSFFILAAAVVGSGLVFGYQQYLNSVLADKETKLAAAEEAINLSNVEEFIRIRNRFAAGQDLLDSHIAISQFLDVLETVTLANVRFNTMTFTLPDEGAPMVEMTGVARTFNALAAQSSAISAEPRIRSAIFSGITVNANSSVSFNLMANLSPSLIMMQMPGEATVPEVPVVPIATSTPATSTPVSTSTPRL